MRFIIHEQPYEKPIVSGELRYFLDAEPTGALESWRLTAATDGYTFLRVDLDARAAASGHTYLYHAVLNSAGIIERLKYRFWDKLSQLQVIGDVVVEDTAVAATRTVNSQTTSAVINMPAGYGIWFPSVIGLGFAVRLKGQNPLNTITLNNKVGEFDTLAALKVDINLELLQDAATEEKVAGQTIQLRNCSLTWQNNKRLVTVDENGWPMRMEREALNGNGCLTAVATRLIYTQRIT